MKICEYCGTRVPDNIMQCEGCGSKEFKNICLKCGSVIPGNKCPKCEAGIKDKRNEQVNQHPIIRHTKPKKNYKLIAVLFLLYFVVVGVMVSDYKANPEKSILSILIVEKPENQVQVEKQKEQKLAYTDLITLKDHPEFYGDYKEAKKFWKKYDDVVVDVTTTGSNEDALLFVGTNDFKVIDNVRINLSDVEGKQNIKLEDVLPLICDYIPYDIIDKYYDFKEAFHEIYKEGKYEAYHYVMDLNEEGKEANKSGEKKYDDKFSFQIIHRNDNDWIAEMEYLSSEGNYKKFQKGAFDIKKWKVNLEKYRD